MQPQVSVSTSFSYDIEIEQQLELVAEAGFSTISLGARQEHFGYLDPTKRSQLKAALGRHGIAIDTIHATGRLDSIDAVSRCTATAIAAEDLGAGCVVAHGGPFDCAKEGLDDRLGKLIDTCLALAPVAESCGVVFALENVMPGPATDLIRKALHELNPAVFGLCYDSSHDQIDGPKPFDLIDEFGGRVFAVHLSDRVRSFVDHVIPGEGIILWPEMCAKLRIARYAGPVLMEVLMQHSRFQQPKVFLREAYNASVRSWQLIHSSTD